MYNIKKERILFILILILIISTSTVFATSQGELSESYVNFFANVEEPYSNNAVITVENIKTNETYDATVFYYNDFVGGRHLPVGEYRIKYAQLENDDSLYIDVEKLSFTVDGSPTVDLKFDLSFNLENIDELNNENQNEQINQDIQNDNKDDQNKKMSISFNAIVIVVTIIFLMIAGVLVLLFIKRENE